jgi:hypothetical protein
MYILLKNIVFHFKEKAMLKLIADYGTLLIGVEGTRLQQEERVKGSLHAPGSVGPPAILSPGAEINRDV